MCECESPLPGFPDYRGCVRCLGRIPEGLTPTAERETSTIPSSKMTCTDA